MSDADLRDILTRSRNWHERKLAESIRTASIWGGDPRNLIPYHRKQLASLNRRLAAMQGQTTTTTATMEGPQ